VLVHDDPTVDAALLDDGSRGSTEGTASSVEAALDHLQLQCERLADTIEGVHGDAWARKATVRGGRTVSALDIAREAVLAGAEHLRAAERAMEAARRG
jgi:NADPH-dependent glutamate synthase beta subunit-like oxidoreductase